MNITPEMLETAIAVATALGLFKGGEYGYRKISEKRSNGNDNYRENITLDDMKNWKNQHDELCESKFKVLEARLIGRMNTIEGKLDTYHSDTSEVKKDIQWIRNKISNGRT